MKKNKGWRFIGNESKYIKDVLESGFGASESGTMNERLEKKFAEIYNLKYAVTANSGTSSFIPTPLLSPYSRLVDSGPSM